MVGNAAGDQIVLRLRCRAAVIAGNHAGHPAGMAEHRFHAPEAAAGKDRIFEAGGFIGLAGGGGGIEHRFGSGGRKLARSSRKGQREQQALRAHGLAAEAGQHGGGHHQRGNAETEEEGPVKVRLEQAHESIRPNASDQVIALIRSQRFLRGEHLRFYRKRPPVRRIAAFLGWCGLCGTTPKARSC